MFNGGDHHIHGGVFTQTTINNPKKYEIMSLKGLGLLLSHSSQGSLLDSKERFDPPKCAEETRDAIIQEIKQWIESDNSTAELLWLFGPAGAGKSALAQSLAELCEKEGNHAASNFFSRTALSTARSDGDRLVPTLVHQLLTNIPDIRSIVESTINKDPTIFQKARQKQMQRLLITPLNKWSFPNFLRRIGLRSFPRLIVIDGLDECRDPAVQCDILRNIALAVSSLRLPFRIIVTSRPEAHLVPVFDEQALRKIPLKKIDLAADLNIHDSLTRFLVQNFNDIRKTHPLGKNLDPCWPAAKDIEFLVTKSAPQFIYASTVAKYVASHDHRPDDRLRVIMRILSTPAHDRPYADLDALYHHIFDEALSRGKRDELYAILGAIHLASDARFLHLQGKTSPSDLEELLGLKPGDVILCLRPLLSLLRLPDDHSSSIKIFHASLFDFLTDTSRSQSLDFSLRPAHRLLGKTLLERIALKLLDNDHGYRGTSDLLQAFIGHWLGYGVTETDEAFVVFGLEEPPRVIPEAEAMQASFLSQMFFHLKLVEINSSPTIASSTQLLLSSMWRTSCTYARHPVAKLEISCSCATHLVHNGFIQSRSDWNLSGIDLSYLESLSFGRTYDWLDFPSDFKDAIRQISTDSGSLVGLDISEVTDVPPDIGLCSTMTSFSRSILSEWPVLGGERWRLKTLGLSGLTLNSLSELRNALSTVALEALESLKLGIQNPVVVGMLTEVIPRPLTGITSLWLTSPDWSQIMDHSCIAQRFPCLKEIVLEMLDSVSIAAFQESIHNMYSLLQYLSRAKIDIRNASFVFHGKISSSDLTDKVPEPIAWGISQLYYNVFVIMVSDEGTIWYRDMGGSKAAHSMTYLQMAGFT